MRTKEREEKQRANEKEKEEKVGVPVFRTLVGKLLKNEDKRNRRDAKSK